MFDPRNEHVVIDSLLPFYPLKSSGYSIDDGFQTIAAWNHLPLRFSNHQSSFLLVPHNLYIYIHQKINTNCPWKQHLHLECSISAGQLQSYQATPANFKANHRHRRKSRTSSAVLDMAATDLPRWGACPNGNKEIWPSLCCLRINNLGFSMCFWAAFLELPNKVTYSRMQRISLRMDWLDLLWNERVQRLMAFLDVFGLSGHPQMVQLLGFWARYTMLKIKGVPSLVPRSFWWYGPCFFLGCSWGLGRGLWWVGDLWFHDSFIYS